MSNLSHIGWSQVNDLLTTYSSYTVSVLYQTLSGTLLPAKHILPVKRSSTSNSSSVSAGHQLDYNVEDNYKATECGFVEVPVDQVEDFIAGSRCSEASDNAVSVKLTKQSRFAKFVCLCLSNISTLFRLLVAS